MQLTSFPVAEFRSLTDVHDIPLPCPTIRTGRNGSGRSSMVHAVPFLLEPSQRVEATDCRNGTPEEPLTLHNGKVQLGETDRGPTS